MIYTPIKRLGEVTLSRVERHFVTCQDCHQTTVLDFTYEQFQAQGARGLTVTCGEYRAPDGSLNYCVYIPECPRCGSMNLVRKQLKKTTFSAKRACGSACREAVSEICTCSCGGLHHGVNHKQGQLTLF